MAKGTATYYFENGVIQGPRPARMGGRQKVAKSASISGAVGLAYTGPRINSPTLYFRVFGSEVRHVPKDYFLGWLKGQEGYCSICAEPITICELCEKCAEGNNPFFSSKYNESRV